MKSVLEHRANGFIFTSEHRNLRGGVQFYSPRINPSVSDVAEATCAFIGWYAVNLYPTLNPGEGFQGFDAVEFIYLGPVLPEFP